MSITSPTSRSPITAQQFLKTVIQADTPQRAQRQQTHAAGEAKEAALAELNEATKAKLRTLTTAYAREVTASLADYRACWTAFAHSHGPAQGLAEDRATNSKLNPQHLGEALGRMLTASGVNVGSVSMQRGARQRQVQRRARV